MERFPANTEAECPFLSPVAEDFGPAKIKDISLKGIRLQVSRRIEPGTLLAVTLTNPARNFSKTVLVRVIHTTPLYRNFLVGGMLTVPLTSQELAALIVPVPPAS